jgi:hypothetical protein
MIRGAGRFLFAVLTAYMLFASVVYGRFYVLGEACTCI